jgi:hypothetical protein
MCFFFYRTNTTVDKRCVLIITPSSLFVCLACQRAIRTIQINTNQTLTMKTTATVLLASLATAAAFTGSSSTAPRSTVAVNSAQADLESLAADLNPSIKYYDPLKLSTWNFWEAGDDATVGFLRHAEIK